MRHRNKTKTLGRTKAHRQAMLRNQLTSLIIYEKIKTTLAKAKVLQPEADKTITRIKRGTLADVRWVTDRVKQKNAVKKLKEVYKDRYKDRKGGYTRIVKLGKRAGDGAEIVIIEYI